MRVGPEDRKGRSGEGLFMVVVGEGRREGRMAVEDGGGG